MMLWSKAWIESRTRFVLAAAVMGIVCVAAIVFRDPVRSFLATRTAPLDTYAWYIYRIHQGFGRNLFMMFSFVLGLGGLLRESELGTAGLTLTLPVRRRRLVLVRATVGLLELVALALLPSIVIVALSPMAGETYPLSQALRFSLLWIAGGSATFAVAFLSSSIFGGEYTAFVVSWIVLFGHTLTTQFIRFSHPDTNRYLFTVQEVMSGFRMWYLDPRTHLLVGPFPLTLVLLVAAISATLVAVAAVYTEQKDF